MCMGFNKYIVLALAVSTIFKFSPEIYSREQEILMYVVAICGLVFLLDKFMCKCGKEHMTNPDYSPEWTKNQENKSPIMQIKPGWVPLDNLENILATEEEVTFDPTSHNPINHLPQSTPSDGLVLGSPGYYLLNNGKFSDEGLSYENAADMIDAGRKHDLWQQYMHLSKEPQHAYAGKDRVPVSFEKIF